MSRSVAKDHDQKRRHILATAARVFSEEGYDRASMNRLAEECGTSKANIYHYYSGKDALLFDLLDCYLSDLRDQVAALDLNGLDPEAQLLLVASELLAAYQGRDYEHRVQINTTRNLPDEKQAKLQVYQRDLVRIVRQVLVRISPDELAPNKPRLRAVTMSLFGMLNWYFMWNADGDREARDEYASIVTDLVLKGIRENK